MVLEECQETWNDGQTQCRVAQRHTLVSQPYTDTIPDLSDRCKPSSRDLSFWMFVAGRAGFGFGGFGLAGVGRAAAR